MNRNFITNTGALGKSKMSVLMCLRGYTMEQGREKGIQIVADFVTPFCCCHDGNYHSHWSIGSTDPENEQDMSWCVSTDKVAITPK